MINKKDARISNHSLLIQSHVNWDIKTRRSDVMNLKIRHLESASFFQNARELQKFILKVWSTHKNAKNVRYLNKLNKISLKMKV